VHHRAPDPDHPLHGGVIRNQAGRHLPSPSLPLPAAAPVASVGRWSW
jgi:hypothetical protein